MIVAQGVNVGVPSKAVLQLQLIDTRGVLDNSMDGKCYLAILRQALFNPNLDETMLAEYQIECYVVKVFSRPRVFGRKELVEARDQVGHSVKIGVSWDVSTRYLDVIPPY